MELLYSLLFLAVIVLFYQLLKPNIIGGSFYIIVLPALLLRFIANLFTGRVTKISFDNENRLILFDRKSILFKTERRAVSFDNCSVETDARSLKQEQLNNFQTLYFMQGKTEVFKLDKSRDGFAESSMKDIFNAIEALSFPVTNL